MIKSLQLDTIWFGIISIVALELGFITPPFGMVVYSMRAALGDEATLEEIFLGAIPFWFWSC